MVKVCFRIYLFQIRRYRRTGKFIEHGGPTGIKKESKLKPLASKVRLFDILVDFGKLVFLMFLGAGKKRTQNNNNLIFGEFWIQTIIQDGPLSSGSGYFS